MSWSFGLSAAPATVTDLRSALEGVRDGSPWVADLLPEAHDQIEAAIGAAVELAKTVVPSEGSQVWAGLSGHANPGNQITEGWANDCVSVYVNLAHPAPGDEEVEVVSDPVAVLAEKAKASVVTVTPVGSAYGVTVDVPSTVTTTTDEGKGDDEGNEGNEGDGGTGGALVPATPIPDSPSSPAAVEEPIPDPIPDPVPVNGEPAVAVTDTVIPADPASTLQPTG